MRRLLLKSAHNMGDLGGYETKDGRTTNFGVVFRSDCPSPLFEEDEETLKKKKIHTVIDLRIQEEISKRPSGFQQLPGVNYHNFNFLIGDRSPDAEEDIPQLYMDMFDDFNNIKRVIETIGKAEGAVVYHCAVGKDRTGVISAVLLGICGVPDTDILADYQISYTHLRLLVRQLREQHPHWPHWMGQSKMEYMEGALALLMEKYGDWDTYLKAVGFEEGTLERIREKMLK